MRGFQLTGGMVKSAARALEIFEHFNRERRPLRLVEIATMLGCATSSAAALLKSITMQGYLSFDPKSRLYAPTGRLAQLVDWVPTDPFIDGIVVDALHKLRDRTGELVVLAIQEGVYLEYVRTIRATESLQLYLEPGTRRLMLQSGAGWLMLARQPEREAMEIYNQTMSRGELTSAVYPLHQFRQHLEDHRQQNMCFTHARDLVKPVGHWDGAMISAILPTPNAQPVMVVGVGGPGDRIREKYDFICTVISDEIAGIETAVEATNAVCSNGVSTSTT